MNEAIFPFRTTEITTQTYFKDTVSRQEVINLHSKSSSSSSLFLREQLSKVPQLSDAGGNPVDIQGNDIFS